MRKLLQTVLRASLLVASFAVTHTVEAQTRVKPRGIITTDGEVDDRSSMIRALLYACDYDIIGIIEVNSRFQKSGHSGEDWLETIISRYGSARPNLLVHNPAYPTAAYLTSICRVGNERSSDLFVAPPDMATKNTAGEQFLIAALLDNDPRPIHVQAWGGLNTVASALWRLKSSGQYTAAQYNAAVAKIRIYAIWYQDGGGAWIEANIPGAYLYEAYKWDNVWDYQSVGSGSENPASIQAYMNSSWLNTNIKTGHSSLGAYYPQSFVSEGDSPAFLHLVNNGLEAHEDYTLGGWAGRGRFDDASRPKHMTDQTGVADDGDANKQFWRWVPAAQNDFAARMDWTIRNTFAGANHAPVARVNGSLVRNAAPGSTVTLDASGTTDPDGNALTFSWWQYYDADSVAARVSINNSTSATSANFVVPNESGKQIQVILEVTDNGSPRLVGYRRVIINIGSGGNPPPPPSGGVIQAEVAALSGGVVIESNQAGFNGSGFLNFPTTGGAAQFDGISGGTSGGSATLTIRFANGASAGPRTGLLRVNAVVQNVTFASTSGWTTWVDLNVPITLVAGTGNVIRFESSGQDTGNIDQITVTLGGGTPPPPPPGGALQAENAVLAGGVTVDTDREGYNGTGFLNFPVTGGSAQFNSVDGGTGGSKTVAIRFANGASAGSRTGRILVNGAAQTITFTSDLNWTNWQTLNVTATFTANAANTIRIESTGQDLANIDEITIP